MVLLFLILVLLLLQFPIHNPTFNISPERFVSQKEEMFVFGHVLELINVNDQNCRPPGKAVHVMSVSSVFFRDK